MPIFRKFRRSLAADMESFAEFCRNVPMDGLRGAAGSGGRLVYPMDPYALRPTDIPVLPVLVFSRECNKIVVKIPLHTAVALLFVQKLPNLMNVLHKAVSAASSKIAQNDACNFGETDYNQLQFPGGRPGSGGG